MINSRSIDDLSPLVRSMANRFVAACKEAGIDIIFTSTYRDFECQDSLYAIGRTVKGADASVLRPMGRTVTKARAGESYHNFRLAFDVVPIVNGKAVWDSDKLWDRIGEIGESVGLEWAGRWQNFKETAHFQFTGGISLADLRAGQKPQVRQSPVTK